MRDANAYCERLDGIEGAIVVRALLVHADPAGAIYDFQVLSAARVLLTGRAALIYAKSPA